MKDSSRIKRRVNVPSSEKGWKERELLLRDFQCGKPKDCGRGSLGGEDSHELEKFHVAATFLAISSDKGRA